MKTNKHGEAHKVEIIDKNLNMRSSKADVPVQKEETPCDNVAQDQRPPSGKITRREFIRMLKDKADEQGEQAAKRRKLRDDHMHEQAREKPKNSSGSILHDIRGTWDEPLDGKMYQGRIRNKELSANNNLLKAGRQRAG